ncbi:MAG: protein kinase [Leptolyngbya sp. SIO1D8]|nr:protein kinase [Leptolyngbya sp. SIO1D8]
MEIVCTRPTCPRPENHFADLDDRGTLTTVQQKFCTACGMPLILSGRYLPEKLLGKGGFGAAFLARDRYTPTMRHCVVKLFQPSGDLSPDQLQLAQSLFQREAAVLEDLGNKHRQIPDLYAFFPLIVPGKTSSTQEEYFYLVQEFIDGEDLEQTLARQGALSASEVVEIFVSMLKVLDFVHTNGTIHRDIKPSNIMRHRNNTLYLLDFGAVKQVTGAQGAPGSKSTGIYSIGFAPPEQMAGGAIYPSTDLYALAVTCITLLTGKEVGELYDSYNNTWAWQPHAKIHPAIATIFDRMLLPAPNQRYASAQEVLEALRSATSGKGKAASQASSSQAVGTSKAVHPSTAMQPPQSGSTSSTLVSGTVGSARQPLQQQSASPPAQPLAKQPSQKPVPQTSVSSVSLFQFLGGAAFTGVEGGLLAIALTSLLGTTWLGSGAWLLLVGGLVLLQIRRVIERFDLVIIAGVTLAIVLVFPPLQTIIASASVTGSSTRVTVVMLAIMAGLAAIAIGTLFRLIYRLLSTFI